MFHIAICDDEITEQKKLKEYCIKFSFQNDFAISVDCFSSGKELLASFMPGKYHMVILDVEMKEGPDGIETARILRATPDYRVIIVYLSSYPEYMQKSFGVRAAQYLSKPLTYPSFQHYINEILQYEFHQSLLMIPTRNGTAYIQRDDILLISSSYRSRHETTIYTKECTFLVDWSLKECMDACADYLVAPNRSELVGVGHIRELLKDCLILDNGSKIPVSRRRYHPLRDEIAEKLRKQVLPWTQSI